MARSDLIIALAQAAALGDMVIVRSTVEAMAADERAKNHHVLAERLQRVLQRALSAPLRRSLSALTPIATSCDTVHEVTPRFELSALQLTPSAKENARLLIDEHLCASTLRAQGFEPRHRVGVASENGI